MCFTVGNMCGLSERRVTLGGETTREDETVLTELLGGATKE